MHPFDLRIRFRMEADPHAAPLPGAHSGPRSPVDPDATPKPHPPLTARQRASEAPRPSVYVNARLTEVEALGEARVLRDLADLTEDWRIDPLTAAQPLFAPELLETPDA